MCGILSGNRGRKGRSEPGQKRNRDKEATVAGNLLARVQVTVAIALKRSVHTTRVRCMYDPAIQPPPRAPLIYIGSDLPILYITRAWIVISLWPSEVQSSGMAVASLCLVPRPPIYRFIRCTQSALFRGWKPERRSTIHILTEYGAEAPPRGSSFPSTFDSIAFSTDRITSCSRGFSSRDEVLSGAICADYCDSFNDGAIRFDAYLFFGSKVL